MLNLIEKIRNILLADITIDSYVKNRVYMSFKPIVTGSQDYPQICLRVDDGGNYDYLNVYRSDLYVYIYTKGDGAQTISGLILKRILQILNQKRFDTPCDDYKIFRCDKDYAVTIFNDDAQVYRTDVKINVICEGD